jgi:hypothetical protein
MLDDGVRQNGSDLRVADVATLLAEALPPEDPPQASTLSVRNGVDGL